NTDQSICIQNRSVILNKLDGLKNASDAISNALYYNEINLPISRADDKCEPTTKELSNFKTSCQNEKVKTALPKLCGSVITEMARKEERRESKRAIEAAENRKWKKINDEYNVVYDRTAPGGYRKYKKQSLGTSIALGTLPYLPQMMFAGLNNMVIGGQIDMLTTQGLYNKQSLHNYNYILENAPWMINGGYNYFMFGGGSTIGTTSTTGTSTTGTIGSGFSF
ncbi:MAG: hypothetical protein K2Q18_01085, partial [Bdellovibrionales bacterium]|nr:hypothetical protein [Bdellovibrionales bacterium]